MDKLFQLLLSIVVVLCWLTVHSNAFTAKFTILHFNDINSQIEKSEDSTGGLASLIGLLKKEENATQHKNIFRIAAGNLIGGQNGWLSLVGWEKFGELVKDHYEPDVMGLGHKEFEGGLGKLNDYISKATRKVLINNVNCSAGVIDASPEKQFCHDHLATTQTLNITSDDGKSSYQVGVVGFVNPIVERLADPGQLGFDDIVPALLNTVSNANGVKTFIAVGSGNLDIANEILAKVDKIKLIVLAGGSYDKYPVKVDDRYIVKAGSNGASYGKVELEIDSDKDTLIITSEPKLIPNDGSGTDEGAEKEVKDLITKIILPASEDHIGYTLVKLNSTRENCWRSECNVGNLIVDSMVHCALLKVNVTEAANTIGVWPSGSMFDSLVYPANAISKLDVHKWLPYHNDAYFVNVNGEALKRIFTSSGRAIIAPTNGENEWGQFLQVSAGIEVKYNEEGEFKSLRVLHLNGSQPVMDDVKDTGNYNLVIPSFMYSGRSVYDYLPDAFRGAPLKTDLGPDDECLYNYIKGLNVLNVGFEKRITIGDEDSQCHCKGSNTAVTVVLTLLIFILIVGVVYVGWKFVWPRISQRGHTSSFP